MNNIKAEPILKWAGGKRQLLYRLLPLVPEYTGKYIEPFVGGGAMFFALNPTRAVLADSNAELINLYKTVAKSPEEVIEILKTYKNSEKNYYKIRNIDWRNVSPEEAAARMIFLNKTCFNGLYRVNRQGKFNTPYGKNNKVEFLHQEQIIAASKQLKHKKIICGDYRRVLKKYAEPGDFIFLDPPYFQISEKESFLRYTKERFYKPDQIELAEIVNDLFDRGCNVLMTNSNHEMIYDLYNRFDICVLTVNRSVNCIGKERKGEDTIIAAFH